MIKIVGDFEFRGFEKEAMQKLRVNLFTQNDMQNIGNILVTDIKDGILNNQDLKSNPFIPNTKKWSEKKGNNAVFIGKTKKLLGSIKVIDITNSSVTVSATGGGLWWQIKPGNKYGALPYYQRDFFGISIRALRKLEEYLKAKFG